MSVILGVSGSPVPQSFQESCDEAVWKTEPMRIAGGRYGAEITIRCTVQPSLGGDLGKLESYSMDEMKKNGTIVQGPTPETFEGMPSNWMDYVVRRTDKDMEVTVRQDLHLANDLSTRMVLSTRSTEVVGTGNADHLKAANVRVEIRKTSDAASDEALFTVYGEVTKPWYLPESVMLSQAKKRGPAEFQKLSLKLLAEMARNY